jgi:hypothetical protein
MLWHAMADGTIRSETSFRQIAFAAMVLRPYALYAAGMLALHRDRTSVTAQLTDAGS